ncbi:hypothetical protein CBR_g34623 [Chara braunii]|uniref:Strictosidine synthase conserved region domain-containing protein n=1 Tax=Chara braunii TaxID=69332 RepID=A0A388LJ44_CHABU|nr:hypothetical protein CBR_g34623 [Chara braunii]|eukprot:GBG82339.1 hypothetical protein CBR_g34623 [Chara braunii]
MLDWITGSRLARTALAKLPSLITLATGKNQGYIMALREDNGVPGVFAVNEDGHARLLVDTVSGKKMKLEDDVDVSSEGVVYFSDASTKYGFDDYVLDILEGRAYGRLLSFDPKTNATNVLLDRLHFANGVTLSSQEDFVLVAETTRYRILRYWLKGPRMGTHDVFANNLPGLVDNIQSNRRGTIWVAISMVGPTTASPLHCEEFGI